MGQASAVARRLNGELFDDHEIFKGIVKAVLSNSTDWSRVERVLPEMNELFMNFDIQSYSNLTATSIEKCFVPWFIARRAGSLTLKRDLTNLIIAAKLLCEKIRKFETLERYITALLRCSNNDPILLAQSLGSTNSKNKLPSMGIAIAAEAIKNIGFDVAKPDRHINRAVGSWRICNFRNFSGNQERNYPSPTNETELTTSMRAVKTIAHQANEKVVVVDNAIWLLCSRSGMYSTNAELRAMRL